MSLRVWLPLNGTLDNQGLDDVVVTNNGATVDNSGKIGKCYNFDGSNNYISFPCSFPSEDWSYSIWFYTTSTNSQTLGCCRDKVGLGFSIFLISNKIRIDGVIGKTNQQWTTTYTYPTNTWTNLIITSKNSLIKYYINGEYQTNKTITVNNTELGNIFTIGASQANGSNLGNYFKGKVNDVRIYDHALSPMEIKQISQGLILHYPLNRNGWGQDNLCTGTIGEKAFTKNANGGYCNPINVYPLGADARSLLQNSEVGDIFTCSFDYEVKNNQIEEYQMKFVLKTASSSFSTEGLEYVFQKGNALSLGDSSGHGEIAFKLKQSHKTYGTGWLLNVAPNKNTNTNIEVTIKNFKFEKGNKATPWRPHPSEITSDSFFNLDNNIEYDCSGYKNNGIKEGTFTYSSDTPKYNVATKFMVSNYIKNINFSFTSNIWSVSFWYYFDTAPSAYQGFICLSKGNGGDANKKIALMPNTSYIWYKCETASGNTGNNSLKVGQWTHITMTCDGTKGRIYENGILKITSSSISSSFSDCDDLVIGARASASDVTGVTTLLNGLMSDVRIYCTALSAEDVLSLYNNSAYIDNQGNIYGAVYKEG